MEINSDIIDDKNTLKIWLENTLTILEIIFFIENTKVQEQT